MSLKDIYMGVETEITYVSTNMPQGRCRGHGDLRPNGLQRLVWPAEGTGNELVGREAKRRQKLALSGGRYQATAYMVPSASQRPLVAPKPKSPVATGRKKTQKCPMYSKNHRRVNRKSSDYTNPGPHV
ncbi:hypothetical protein BJX66DRAFT_185514 [Aspergillus keveii]|uniref:Uncharacterized protein n=1 Tax=Aspergillus keveii TaxID=714993 RepID=A0ABR4GMR8_9EURO